MSAFSFCFIKQVRLNKDASDGGNEDKFSERDLPDLLAGCLFQVVGR